MATHPDGRPVAGLSQGALVDVAPRMLASVAGADAAAAMPVESFHDDGRIRLPQAHAVAVFRALRDDAATRVGESAHVEGIKKHPARSGRGVERRGR